MIERALLAAVLLAVLNTQAATPAATIASGVATPRTLEQEQIAYKGKLVKAYAFADKGGPHLLVLSQHKPAQLRAQLFKKDAGRWKEEWAIRDAVDCHPDMDVKASFFADAVTFTDVDGNGQAEVTVAYKMFCGGGVDPSVLKVIMRQGAQKLAMRGTTRIVGPKNEPAYGGEAVYDNALALAKNQMYKAHIDAVRRKVVVERWK